MLRNDLLYNKPEFCNPAPLTKEVIVSVNFAAYPRVHWLRGLTREFCNTMHVL